MASRSSRLRGKLKAKKSKERLRKTGKLRTRKAGGRMKKVGK